jgi:hypothetical protein
MPSPHYHANGWHFAKRGSLFELFKQENFLLLTLLYMPSSRAHPRGVEIAAPALPNYL